MASSTRTALTRCVRPAAVNFFRSTKYAQIVNPNIEIKHTKLMTAGDDYCELLFIEKDPSRE